MLDKWLMLLQFSIVDGRLFLDTSSPIPPAASALLRSVPGKVLDLVGAQAELTGAGEDAALVIRGDLRYDWPLQAAPKAELTRVHLAITIGRPQADGETSVRFEARGLLKTNGAQAPFTGLLDAARGHWLIRVEQAEAHGLDVERLLSLPWGTERVAALPRKALDSIRLKQIDRFLFEWDPGAGQAPDYPIQLQARAELFGQPCSLELSGGPADLAVKALWAGEVCTLLQARTGDSLREYLQEALSDFRDLEEFAHSFGGEATNALQQVHKVIQTVRTQVGTLDELKKAANRSQRLQKLKGEVDKLSKRAAQARFDAASKAVPELQARLHALEGEVAGLRARLEGTDQSDPNAQNLAPRAVHVYRQQLQKLHAEMGGMKQSLVSRLKRLGSDDFELSVALDLLTDAPQLMALLGARQSAREELQSMELQLQFLQENADGEVKLPAHLHPDYAALIVERNLVRRELSTESSVQNTLGLILRAWPETLEALMETVPRLVEAVKALVETALGDMERWNRPIVALQLALAGSDLFQVERAGVTAPVTSLAEPHSEVEVGLVVQGSAVPVRLLCDPRAPVTSGASKLASVLFNRLKAKPEQAA